MAVVPVVGSIVLYQLTAADALTVNEWFSDARRQGGVNQYTGVNVNAGNVFPMIVTNVQNPSKKQVLVNGQVFLDGNDTFWVHDIAPGNTPGTYV